ncbi:MAG: VanZ family protein [Phycisphaerales bacterium]|nr:VanZ family protein [Phycisphaerales bacterium]
MTTESRYHDFGRPGLMPPGSPGWWSLRWRRGMAVMSVLVLLIGTHYPRLVIGAPGDGPDKILHFLAFAAVTVMLRISGIASTNAVAIVVMIGLAIFDEVTQQIPGLGRSFDWLDLVADTCGILVAVAWIAALSPSRNGPDWFKANDRRTLASLRFLLATGTNWLHLGIATALGAMIGGTLLGVAGRNPVVGPVTMVVVGAATGAIAGLIAALEAGRRHASGRIRRERRCLHCLAVEGGDPCSGCGTPIDTTVHREIPARRSAFIATGWSIVTAAAIASLYFLAVNLASSISGLGSALRRYDALGLSFEMMVDATILGFVGAFVVYRSRRRLALIASRLGLECLRCRHDLRGLSTSRGTGRCPECGEEFILDPQPGGIAEKPHSEEHAGA